MNEPKYTFRIGNKYPVNNALKVKWVYDREEALRLAKGFGATELLELDAKGNISKTEPLMTTNPTPAQASSQLPKL